MGCIEVLRSMRSLDFSTRTQVTREAINRLHEAVPGVRGSWKKKYMGCIEVLRSMRSLDFSTRTQVTREAINRLHEAVPGVRGSWKKKAPNKALASILGKSNLRFAGMSISVNISIDGLNLLVPATRQVIASHHMQSISFASGGDTDMTDYVAYVAKDPINQRACHILECCEGLAQSVISTVGQAFELRFKQYLHSPPKAVVPPERLTGLEESAWGDEEEVEGHNYYNSIPGKEPPPGGLVDSRLAITQPCGLAALGQGASPFRRDARSLQWDQSSSGSAPPGDGYVQADARGPRDYEEHLYVNTQGLDAPEPEDLVPPQPEESPKKDLFDMRPFEDALRLHECAAGIAEDQWPSPPTRRAPVAPTEEQLRQEPWYHGRMSRRAAERLLRADGDFLVRDSVTNPGQYVLTGMHAGQPKHLLLVDPEGVVRTKDVLFESISHLIDYHLQNGQPIVAAESELHLRGVPEPQNRCCLSSSEGASGIPSCLCLLPCTELGAHTKDRAFLAFKADTQECSPVWPHPMVPIIGRDPMSSSPAGLELWNGGSPPQCAHVGPALGLRPRPSRRGGRGLAAALAARRRLEPPGLREPSVWSRGSPGVRRRLTRRATPEPGPESGSAPRGEHIVRVGPRGSVRLLAEYEAAQARLRVRLLVAEGLYERPWEARSINCCVGLCLVPGKLQKQRSTIIKNSRHPVFNEDFFFDGLGPASVRKLSLRIKVVNKGSSLKRDTLLGEKELPLTSLLPFL
ncbi:SHC-transforming protein 2 [Heterocephalus glaber]|uniref:C2 calcium-dependent domain-containing protein 4C n=1 Tax=Heterocephalus glaber TaxID=10181 RepID=G5B3R9_HETGA|nr:SHC-transforming protein 2 [Heterocephalus glaber]